MTPEPTRPNCAAEGCECPPAAGMDVCWVCWAREFAPAPNVPEETQ